MSWTYESVMQHLGEEAQAVAGAIVVYRDRHITVARISPDQGFAVTDEGFALLGPAPATEEQPAAKPAAKSSRKPAKTEDDLEL